MAKILSEKVIKDLKLVKVVTISRYWRSWWPFNEAFRRLQILLRRSMTTHTPIYPLPFSHILSSHLSPPLTKNIVQQPSLTHLFKTRHLLSHMILWLRGHVTSQTRNISSLLQSIWPHLVGWWLRVINFFWPP